MGLRGCILNTQCTLIPGRDILPEEECKLNAETYYGLVRYADAPRPFFPLLHGLLRCAEPLHPVSALLLGLVQRVHLSCCP